MIVGSAPVVFKLFQYWGRTWGLSCRYIISLPRKISLGRSIGHPVRTTGDARDHHDRGPYKCKTEHLSKSTASPARSPRAGGTVFRMKEVKPRRQSKRMMGSIRDCCSKFVSCISVGHHSLLRMGIPSPKLVI